MKLYQETTILASEGPPIGTPDPKNTIVGWTVGRQRAKLSSPDIKMLVTCFSATPRIGQYLQVLLCEGGGAKYYSSKILQQSISVLFSMSSVRQHGLVASPFS